MRPEGVLSPPTTPRTFPLRSGCRFEGLLRLWPAFWYLSAPVWRVESWGGSVGHLVGGLKSVP